MVLHRNVKKKQNYVLWIQAVFIVYIKTEEIYADIAKDIEARFDTSSYELDRPSPKGKNKKVIGLMKDELGRKIMKEFVRLRAKTYSYLINDGSEDKKTKRQKTPVIKLNN